MAEKESDITLDDLIDDMGGQATEFNWQTDTIAEEDEGEVPRLNIHPVLEKKQVSDLSTQGHLEIDVGQEEDELKYYKGKLAEQVQATREILGNFQLVSRRSKITEGLAERYKEELSKHKEYLNHLLEQQSGALSAYKSKILVLDKERSEYRDAFRELREEFKSYKQQAREYIEQLSQKNNNSEELEEYRTYAKKLEDFSNLQKEKKEFYKEELRKRVINEHHFQDRENSYLRKIEKYQHTIARLSNPSNIESKEQGNAEIQKPEENPEREQQEQTQEVKHSETVVDKKEEVVPEKQEAKQEEKQ